MATQNLKRKKNNNLKDQKRTRMSEVSAIIKPLSAKLTRKRVEETLQKIEERFRLAFENANIGMCLVDLQGRLTKVNHQMCEIFGYSQEELERMTVNDIAHPEDLNISPTFVKRATSGEIEHTTFEKRYFHKDGHIVWGAVSSSLVRDPQAVPQYFISHVQDITQRKKAEEALKESERFLSNTFSSIQDGLSILDTELNILRVNPALEQWYSHAIPLIGKKCYEAYHGRTERCEVCPTYQTINTGKGAYEVVPKTGKGGKIVGWLDLFSFPLIDTVTGKMKGVIEYVRDISDRKRAEETLKTTNERLNYLLTSTSMAIYTSKAPGDYGATSITENVKQITGYEPREFIKNSTFWIDHIHPEDKQRILNEVPRIFEQGSHAYEYRFLYKDGTYRWIRDEMKLVRSEDGKPLEIVGHWIDITGRKRAEQALRRSEGMAKQMALENAVMAEIGRIINSTLNTEEVYERFAEEVRELIPFDGIAINIINHKEGTVTVPYVAGINFPGCQPGDAFPLEGSVTGEVAHKRAGLIIRISDRDDFRDRFHTLLTAFDTGLRSVMAVPLISKDQVIGAIHFRSTKPNAYSDHNLKLAEDIASQIAGAIANGQLFMEHKQTEEALRSEHDKFRGMLSALGDGVDIINKNYIIEFQNELLRERYGEKIGEKCFSAYMGLERPCDFCSIQEAIRTGLPTRIELVAPDSRNYELNSSPFMDVDGEVKVIELVRDITERKRADEALCTEKQRFQTLSEQAPFGMVMIDQDGTFKYINHKFIELFGYDLTDVPDGKTWFRKAYPDPTYRHEVISDWVNDLGRSKPGEKRSKVFTVTCKGGTEKNVNFISVQLEKGEHLMVCEDITEQKRAEDALRESEERYRNILSNIEDGYYEVDISGNFSFFNSSLCKILGYPKEEMMGMNNRVYMDKETARRVYYAYNQVFTTGEPLKAFGYKIIRKDGIERFVESHVSLLTNAKGERIGFRGIARDMTERKQAEENLTESEEKYRLLVEESLQGIVIGQGNPPRLVFANPAMTKILGYTNEELSSLSPKEIEGLVHPEDRAFFFKNYKDRLEGKSVTPHYELRGIRKDGAAVWLELSSVRIEYKGQPAVQAAFLDITERKQAEENLKESEERYRTILENIEDGYYEVDLLGNFTFFNESLCRMLGYSREEMIGMGNQQYTDEENRKKLFQAFNKVYRTGVPTNAFDWEVIRKDGAKVFGEISVSPIKDSKGQPIGFRGIARDITERKRSEESLEKSEMRFMELFNDAPVGYFEYNVEGLITNVNRTYLEMLGYKFEEMIGKPVWKFIVENELARQQILETLVGITPPARGIERTYRRKDGATLPVLVGDRVLRDSAGKITGIRTTIHDITERKHAEEALKESEEKYRQLVEYAPSGIFEIDLNTLKFLNVNDVMCEVMGYSKEELFSMSPVELLTEESRNLLAERMKKTRPGEKIPDSAECKLRKKDKSEFWALVNTKMFYKDGKPFKAQVVAQDISERKRLEEQLSQSQKMEAVGQLAGGIAHDFNNLLTVIKGYGHLSLLNLKEGDTLWGNIQEIQKATQRASDLTRQLLAFSRRQILDPKVLNLNSLVKDLNKMLHRIIGEDIELITLLDEDLGRVKVDPGQIEQMILNLAVNARDAMPSGGKLIIETKDVEIDAEYVAAHIGLATGRYVRLSVSDTGVGMSKEIIEKAFEPFFTTKETGKGTGLGLSTVYGIVKQSGGSIWVYSEPGYGTTFNIYLPRVKEDLDALGLREESDFLPKGSETVLLVEDESSVRNLAYRILCQQGYTVLEAANGHEALCIAQERIGKKIDLLLTDVVMPKMSGKELADRIKTLMPELKVLFTSGYTNDAIVHHGVLAPGTHFLQKPFSFKSLSCKVREVLDQ